MSTLDLVLDHVGIAVNDLDAGKAAFERMGFRLTARSFHKGALEPGGPIVPWGSGNHCAMLRDGYLEILGIFDQEMPSNARKLLAKYEGAHIVAFGVDRPAEDAYEILRHRHPAIKAPVTLTRMAPFGPSDETEKLAEFRNMNADPAIFEEGRFIFIDHRTRDVLWQPHLLDHPNGAVGLAEVAIASADPAATIDRLGKALGAAPNDKGHGIATFTLARGTVYILPGNLVGKWAKGVEPPHMPYIAGFGITVSNLAATGALLEANGVPYQRHPYPAIWVAPEHTCGPVVSFIQT